MAFRHGKIAPYSYQCGCAHAYGQIQHPDTAVSIAPVHVAIFAVTACGSHNGNLRKGDTSGRLRKGQETHS